jgi:O-antigen/teichoic acid export membrane protein
MKPDLHEVSAKGVLWNVLQSLVRQLSSLVFVVVLARLLDRETFGVVALATAVTALAELFVSQGFQEFVIQRKDLEPEHLNSAFLLNLALGIVLATIVVLSARPAAEFFDDPRLVMVLRWLALGVLMRSLTVVQTGLLTRDGQFRALALRSVVGVLPAGVTGIAVAMMGGGVMSLVLQTLVADVLSLLFLWRASEWRPGWRVSARHVRDLLGFGMPILGATLLLYVSRRLDALIISRVLGNAVLGEYAMAQRVFQMTGQLVHKSGDSVALSAFARLAAEPDERRKAFYGSIELASAICFPVYAGIAVVAEPLTLVLFGSQWIRSAPALAIISLSGLAMTSGYLHAAMLKATGQPRAVLAIQAAIATTYIGLLAILVHHGIASVAAANVIALMVAWPLQVWLVRRAAGIEVAQYLRCMVVPFFAAALMAGVVLALEVALNRLLPDLIPLVELGILVVAGACLYAAVLRVFSRSLWSKFESALRAALRRRRTRA